MKNGIRRADIRVTTDGHDIVTTEPFTRTGDNLPEGIPADIAEIVFERNQAIQVRRRT